MSVFGEWSVPIAAVCVFVCKILILANISCLQVREASITTLVDVYRYVGERVRADLAKRGLPAAR